MSDFDLLLRYRQGSQHSFAELVRRHWGWVYAAALADQVSGVLVAATLKIAAACCILLLSAAALPLVVQWFAARPQAPRVQTRAVMPVTTAAVSGAIKVGWMVSEWTANEHPYGRSGSFDSVTAIRQRFLDPQIELYPIIEPGTTFPTTLTSYFKSGRVIDGSDAAALSKMDVIVCSRDWNMRPQVMEAILEAVNNGTGLLWHLSTGIFGNEGRSDLVARINCIDEPRLFWTRDTVDCVVVSDHPLLAGIRQSLPDGRFTMANVNGCIGIVHGTPLIVAEEGTQSAHGEITEGLGTAGPTTTTAPMDRRLFFPMFVSQIGKGRVVACQWDSIPTPLAGVTRGRFYIRCVQWLANRPLD